MTYHSTNIVSVSMQTWMKKTIGLLMLASLVIGQTASAQVTPVGATESTIVVQPELITVPVVEPSVQQVLLNVCESNGYGEDCAKTLLGMLWNESSNRSTVIGDGGQARGYFQIHYRLHKISIACAEDLVCAANWSLNYMEAHSYPKYVKYAVQCHNSCNVNNGYAAKAIRNGNIFWNKPLAINQTAPIELAME
ncbi:MAG: hypothetical protein WCK01_03380 [Candidatus Uhrbacteria bacterium]